MQESTSSIEDLLGIEADEVAVRPTDLEEFTDRYFHPRHRVYFVGRGMVDKKGRHYLFQVRGGTKGFIEMSIRMSKDNKKAQRQVRQMNLRMGFSPEEALILVKYAIQPEAKKAPKVLPEGAGEEKANA
ncbi:MAG: hypothetical protein KAR06_06960 [Deltaproteobacteria bacterium]|nr:hypothetical protein [Deltaproteobacteria bacterium]